MYRFSNPMGRKYVLIAAFVSVFIASALARAQVEKDPYRPACTDARCRKVRSFLKANYCGASPFGNGPDDGCEIKDQGKPRPGVGVLADYRCEWDQSEQAIQCEQHGEPTPALRKLLVGELHGIGLPANANGQTFFKVWKSGHSGWSIAEGYYSRSAGSDVELCEVIIVVDDSSRRIVLRKLPFQRTDVDVPTVVQWAPIDLADADGDGQEEVILEGDAYENHWLEAVSVREGSARTIFSGLGYYL